MPTRGRAHVGGLLGRPAARTAGGRAGGRRALRDAERLAETTGPGAEQPRRVEAPALAHQLEARERLERADEHGLRAPPSSAQTRFRHQWIP